MVPFYNIPQREFILFVISVHSLSIKHINDNVIIFVSFIIVWIRRKQFDFAICNVAGKSFINYRVLGYCVRMKPRASLGRCYLPLMCTQVNIRSVNEIITRLFVCFLYKQLVDILLQEITTEYSLKDCRNYCTTKLILFAAMP